MLTELLGLSGRFREGHRLRQRCLIKQKVYHAHKVDRTLDVKDVEVVSSTKRAKRGQEAARVTVGVVGSQQNAAKIALGTGTFCQEIWMDGSA